MQIYFQMFRMMSSRKISWQALRWFHIALLDLKLLWSLFNFPMHIQQYQQFPWVSDMPTADGRRMNFKWWTPRRWSMIWPRSLRQRSLQESRMQWNIVVRCKLWSDKSRFGDLRSRLVAFFLFHLHAQTQILRRLIENSYFSNSANTFDCSSESHFRFDNSKKLGNDDHPITNILFGSPSDCLWYGHGNRRCWMKNQVLLLLIPAWVRVRVIIWPIIRDYNPINWSIQSVISECHVSTFLIAWWFFALSLI